MLSSELKKQLLSQEPLEEAVLKEAYLCTIEGSSSEALVTLFPLIQARNISRLSAGERANLLERMRALTEVELDVSDQVMLAQCVAKVITKHFDEKLMEYVFVASGSSHSLVRGAAILPLEYAARIKVKGAFDKIKEMTLDSDSENAKFANKALMRLNEFFGISDLSTE